MSAGTRLILAATQAAAMLVLAACGGPAPREGGDSPMPAESHALEAARKAMLSPSDEGAKPWLDLARSDPAQALRLAREFLGGCGEDDFRWGAAAPLLKRLVGLGTPEAVSLVLEFMEKPEREFEAGGERSEAFFQALRAVPGRFARQVEEAAVRRIRRHAQDESALWDTMEGYCKLAGLFSSGEGEAVLRELYALPQGYMNLTVCALRGLLQTGKTELIGFLLDSAFSLDFLASEEAGEIAVLGRKEFIEALMERVADSPPRGRPIAARGVHAEMLGRCAGRQALPFLEGLFAKADEASRTLAVRGLRRVLDITDPAETARARAIVLRGLEDADPGVRIVSCRTAADRDFLPHEESLAALTEREAAEREEEVLEHLRDAIRDLREAMKRTK